MWTYDAWGNILSTTGSMASTLGQLNPLRYRGYVYDSETGFYYLQSRYYDPTIGRFINADIYVSTGQGLLGNNMFVYCLNNPIKFSDKTGEIVDDYGDMAAEAIFEFLYEFFTGGSHPNKQTRHLETQIILQQNEMIGNVFTGLWNAYMTGYALQQQAQLLEAQVMLDGVKATYNFLDETGIINAVLPYYRAYQTATALVKVASFVAIPVPSFADEGLAILYALKGGYHYHKILEATK